MSTLKKIKESLLSETNEPSNASFNIQNNKKLKSIEPIDKKSEVVETKKINYKNLSIIFPQYQTLIDIRPNIDLNDILSKPTTSPRKAININTDKSDKFFIDNVKKVLVIGEGYNTKEYPLDILTSKSSRTGKTISKSDAAELANVYLKLNIKAQNKKDIFIKEIRAKIGLPPE
jgi:hypothetical protein